MSPIRLHPKRPLGRIPFRRKWGCPLTKNASSWCFALCEPEAGMGSCGRIAGHALLGRTDRALRDYKRRKLAGKL